MAKLTWKYITKEATSIDQMNRKDAIAFHWFNPNGLIAKSNKLVDELFIAVDEKRCKSGALLAYNFDFARKEIAKLHKSSQPSWRQIRVWIEMTSYSISELEKFLQSIK